MRILITGGSGFVGSHLSSYLAKQGHTLLLLSRDRNSPLYWNEEEKIMPIQELEGLDAVIHLAGESITKKRWTSSFKQKIWTSRVNTTQFLVSALLHLKNPPRTFIGASATGIYGDRGNEELNESSLPGTGFLPSLCSAWECASKPLEPKKIRVVHMRFGIILSREAGPFAKLLKPFKWGLGATLGSGKQYISWIALEDLIPLFEQVLLHSEFVGPINCTSPNPITHQTFTKLLAFALKKPAFLKIPPFMLRLILGEMADPLFLASTRAVPQVLEERHHPFLFPTFKEWLIQSLKQS